MCDLTSNNYGCGGNNSCLWIILILLFCGNGFSGYGNGCGNGCGSTANNNWSGCGCANTRDNCGCC